MGVFLIAEAGVNHNGNADLARRLVEEAANAGVDAVKFQTFSADRLLTQEAALAPYQARGGWSNQYSLLRSLELPPETFLALKALAEERGLEFLSTAFDVASLEWLISIGMKRIKIASGEIDHLALLRTAAGSGLPLLLSVGTAEEKEILAALEALFAAGANKAQVTLLQTNTAYPTPPEDGGLLVMKRLGEITGCAVGYSDHTEGVAVSLGAVALGAKVVERHFTLDKNLAGPDHSMSLEPGELGAWVKAVRSLEAALTGGRRTITPSERENRQAVRRSLVAARPIAKGTILTGDDLIAKRPGGGRSPMDLDGILGQTASKDYERDDPF